MARLPSCINRDEYGDYSLAIIVYLLNEYEEACMDPFSTSPEYSGYIENDMDHALKLLAQVHVMYTSACRVYGHRTRFFVCI